MKKKILLFIGLLMILPISALAEETAVGECAGQIGLQHLNSQNDVGRYWNISIGKQRVFCIDEGKKARTGEICVRGRAATNEEIGMITRVENSGASSYLSAPAYDAISTSTGQGQGEAGIAMALVTNGVPPSTASYLTSSIMSTSSSSGKSYSIWYCNGDANGDVWQRMLVEDNPDLCFIPEKEEEVCPPGRMEMDRVELVCTDSKKDGKGNTFKFTYSVSGEKGGLHNVSQMHGEDLGAPVGKYCRVYCTEEGWAILPGSTGEALQVGSYIVWPTSSNNFTTDKFKEIYYPLKFKGSLVCKLDVMSNSNSAHAAMPVGCKTSVEDLYEENWATINPMKNSIDIYESETYEQIRFNRIKRTSDPYGSCLKQYNNKSGELCAAYGHKLRVEGHFNKYDGCIEIIVNGLVPETRYREELFRQYDAVKSHCDDPDIVRYNCYNPSTGQNDAACPPEPSAEKLDCISKKAEYEAQKEIVGKMERRRDELKDAVTACEKYVDAYEKNARIIQEMHKCDIWSISEDDYRFNSSVQLKYSDNKYNIDGDLTLESSKQASSPGKIGIPDFPDTTNVWVGTSPFVSTGEFNSKIQALASNDRTYSVDAEDIYSLKTNYHYINKDNLEYLTSIPKNLNGEKGDYLQIVTKKKENGETVDNKDSGVIPTSSENDVNKSYYLILHDISFGQAGFGTGDNMSGSDYECVQRFVRNNDKCVCPEDTKNAGKSLACYLNGLTCAEAQSKYCDDETFIETDDCNLYCTTNPSMSLLPCLNSGKTYDECNTEEYCNPIKCPNSEEIDDPSMDDKFRDCYMIKRAQGISPSEASKYCDKAVCNGNGTIIYRTIKLENPFPSYDADGSISQNLKVGDFNNTIVGRYPGYNWNSQELVLKKIRQNRGADGTQIYFTREPLYTFVLNSTTISNIRNYNDKVNEGYNDFNLNCYNSKNKNNDGKNIACISRFVHGTAGTSSEAAGNVGLVGGTCMNATSKEDFDSCITTNNYNRK